MMAKRTVTTAKPVGDGIYPLVTTLAVHPFPGSR
jgi:hypothetical protein